MEDLSKTITRTFFLEAHLVFQFLTALKGFFPLGKKIENKTKIKYQHSLCTLICLSQSY